MRGPTWCYVCDPSALACPQLTSPHTSHSKHMPSLRCGCGSTPEGSRSARAYNARRRTSSAAVCGDCIQSNGWIERYTRRSRDGQKDPCLSRQADILGCRLRLRSLQGCVPVAAAPMLHCTSVVHVPCTSGHRHLPAAARAACLHPAANWRSARIAQHPAGTAAAPPRAGCSAQTGRRPSWQTPCTNRTQTNVRQRKVASLTCCDIVVQTSKRTGTPGAAGINMRSVCK